MQRGNLGEFTNPVLILSQDTCSLWESIQ